MILVIMSSKMNDKDRQSENDVKQFVQLPGCIPDKENLRQGLFF